MRDSTNLSKGIKKSGLPEGARDAPLEEPEMLPGGSRDAPPRDPGMRPWELACRCDLRMP